MLGAELVEQANRVLTPIAGEVAVVAVDHRQAGSHVARDVEGGDSGTKREGRKGMAEIVDAAERIDAGGTLSGSPLVGPKVVHVEVAATLARKDKL